jgi:hypothetical protein
MQEDTARNTVSARVRNSSPLGKMQVNFDVVVPTHTTLEITSNAGSISVSGVDGQLQLSTDAGTIDANGVHLRGPSRLKTNAGTINFHGSLDPEGDYTLSTDLGTVDATLPADASFFLDARTDLGTISGNLPLTKSANNRLTGQVGNGPYPNLKLKTNLGTVTVNRL